MEETITEEKSKNTGMVYITDNDNMFLAPEDISQEEQNRLSLEVDRDVLMEKLAKIEEELKALPNQEHKEEIERDAPFTEPYSDSTPSDLEQDEPQIEPESPVVEPV